MYVHIRRQMTCKYGCVLLLCREIGVETVREGGREGEGRGEMFTPQHVCKFEIFEFCEVLARVDRVRSLQILVDLLDQGQSELGIIALLARHFRILLLLKKGSDEGLAGQKLASYAQVPSYYLQKYHDQSRIWSQRKLEQGMILLAETDKALKSSPVSAPIWLDNMVLRLTQIQQS